MPAFLVAILEKLLLWGAPMLVRAALVALEKKYPGLKSIIESILTFIEQSPNQSEAIQATKAQVDQLRYPTGNDLKN